KEKIERPVMTENRSREPLDIVRDEKGFEKLPAINHRTQNEPRGRDGCRYPKARRMPVLPIVPCAAQRHKTGKRERRQQQSDWTFGKNTEAGRRIESKEPETTLRLCIVQTEEKKHQRHRETSRQWHVCGRRTRKGKPTD